MAKTYVTFGSAHRHEIGEEVFDKDCVAVIECEDEYEGRARAFALFGPKFCFEYHENKFTESSMQYFPRGKINVKQ